MFRSDLRPVAALLARTDTPRTLRIDALGVEVRAERTRDVRVRWLFPRSIRRSRPRFTCEPRCAGAPMHALFLSEAFFDQPWCRPPCVGPSSIAGREDIVEAKERNLCWGKLLLRQAGCISCHSDSPDVNEPGPSFAGIWGATRVFEDGRSVVVDASYIRRAILTPQSDVVRGHTRTSMNPHRLSDRQIAALVAFIASLETQPPAPVVNRRRSRVNHAASSNRDTL